MAIKNVLRMGDERLLKVSEEIARTKIIAHRDFLSSLLNDMKDTMAHYQGVGIAAPQIGVNVRVILFGFEANDRYPNEQSIPETFIINPTYKVLGNQTVPGLEGCLSVPGLRGSVDRFYEISYSGYSIDGELIERTVSGFHARVIQHECDHLDGILFPFRIKDFSQFGYEDIMMSRK